MLLESLGEVIATRELFVRDDPTHRVVIMMGKPRLWDDGRDYLCPILITGIGEEKSNVPLESTLSNRLNLRSNSYPAECRRHGVTTKSTFADGGTRMIPMLAFLGRRRENQAGEHK